MAIHEWLPSITGVVGVVTGGLIAWGGWKHGERVTKVTHQHEAAMAYEERQQQRIESSYVELLETAERVHVRLSLTLQVLDGQLSPTTVPAPKMPTIDDLARVNARALAHGSTQVQPLLEDWRDVINRVFALVDELKGGSRDGGETRQLAQECLDRETEVRTALSRLIATELRSLGRR